MDRGLRGVLGGGRQGRRRIAAAAALTAGALITGVCSSSSSTSGSSANRAATGSLVEEPVLGGWDCPGGSCSWSSGAGTDATGTSGEHEAFDSVTAGSAGGSTSKRPSPTTTVAAPPDPGRLPQTGPAGLPVTAGSIDDNETWSDYLLYRRAFDQLGVPVDRIPVEGRQVITVVDAAGRPVLGADVQIQDANHVPVAQLRTYADGRALFHPLGYPDPGTQQRPAYTATITKGAARASLVLTAEQRSYTATLDQAVTRPAVQLDVLFLVDTTGSMGDEIDRLKANIGSISRSLTALPGRPDVHFAMTAYHDRGDVFVSRTFNFTADHNQFASALEAVQADGGGDTPEDLDAGLADAVTKPAWRGPDAVKLVFLIADAPPHLDEPDGVPYGVTAAQAASKGIKIMPIAASGLDAQGEYIFRQLAQLTLGRFVFLTYGADGTSPGAKTPHHVKEDQYSVLPLDELVVKLISDEIAKGG